MWLNCNGSFFSSIFPWCCLFWYCTGWFDSNRSVCGWKKCDHSIVKWNLFLISRFFSLYAVALFADPSQNKTWNFLFQFLLRLFVGVNWRVNSESLVNLSNSDIPWLIPLLTHYQQLSAWQSVDMLRTTMNYTLIKSWECSSTSISLSMPKQLIINNLALLPMFIFRSNQAKANNNEVLPLKSISNFEFWVFFIPLHANACATAKLYRITELEASTVCI